MKRTLPILVIGVNLMLILGWIGFELFVDDEIDREDAPRSVSRSLVPSESGVPTRQTQSSESLESTEPTTEPTTTSDRFDWRRPRNAGSLPVTQAIPPRPPSREEATGPARDDGRASPSQRSGGGNRVPAPARDRTSPITAEVASPANAPSPPGEAKDDPVAPEKPKDPSEDRVPPDLEWLRFTPSEVMSGAETTLSASAIDDLAGVRDLVGRISSPSGNAHIGFALPKNEATALWETLVRIPEKAESGQWSISWLRITDKANNTRDHRWQGGSGPPGSTLLVRSPDGDGEPPVLQSVALDRTTIGAGESVQVEVVVTDEPSGVRFVSGTFQSPSGKAWAPFTATGEGSIWTGAVSVPDDSECGEWSLRRVTAIDNANNQATWGAGDERIEGIRFYRSFSGSCDSDPPELTRLELSPRTVANEIDSQIEVTAFIDDLGSGVSSASGFAIAADPSNGSPQRVHFVLQRSAEGVGAPWTGTIRIPRHSMAGKWDIRALRVADAARNQRTYGPADPVMSTAWFIVE